MIIAFGKPFSFLVLLLRRFELGDEAVIAGVDVAAGAVAERDVLVGVVVVQDDGVLFVMADVELVIGVGVWLDSLDGLEDEAAADEDASETVIVCFTVDDTSEVSSVDLIGVEGGDVFKVVDSGKKGINFKIYVLIFQKRSHIF